MRAAHRWIMTVGCLLLLYWVVTGVSLAVVDISDRAQGWAHDGGGPSARTPRQIGGLEVATAAPLGLDALSTMTTAALSIARAAGISAPIAAIELASPHAQPRVTLTLSQSGRRVIIDTAQRRIADEHASAAPPGNDPEGSLHSQVKNWHRGTVGNAANNTLHPGNILALLAGLTLLAMTLTGIVLYLQAWRARRRLERAGFFWSERGAHGLRRLHRWIAIMAAVFVLNQCVTGSLLAMENIAEQFHHGAEHAARPVDFADDELLPWLQDAYRQARAVIPSAPLIAITLLKNDGEPFAPVFVGGEHSGAIGFKLMEHRYIFGSAGMYGPGDAPIDRHSLLKRLHRGDVIGVFAGRFVTLTAGLCLLYLLFSGIWMYLELQRSRSRGGRLGWFWR